VWQRLGSNVDGVELFTHLLEAYRQPHRAYHTVAHIEACLYQLDGYQLDVAQTQAERPAEVEMALWFHDAVYGLKAADNEAQSALWAAQALHQSGVSAVVSDRITTMILATTHDRPPETHDCALLLDIDLSILGQSPEAFAVYEQHIRTEYHWVTEKQYRAGRAAILEQFLARSTIYYTPFFQARLEAQARWNLERSIATLCGQRF
jgi:predicted metal-dependent HD superfamily phosphohydrolase